MSYFFQGHQRPPKRQVYSMNLDVDLMNQVDTVCREGGMNRSYFLREAIKMALEKVKDASQGGWVYFVQIDGTDLYKIGCTQNLEQRLKQLEQTIPFDVELVHQVAVNHIRRAEKAFHNYFSESQRKGETFRLTPEEIRWLKTGEYRYVKEIADEVSGY